MPTSLSDALASPALPVPTKTRWQPLRLGLVNLFYYDSEEFHFRDGRLLLRGNNGTGKSKVLSLTLPFLLDAQTRPSRIEPDGDNTKKMAWNLLLGRHERRMGYSWIEFGRISEQGQAQYLTLGCGMSAVAARSHVKTWYFTQDKHRIGEHFWLMNAKRVVLTEDKLNETLQGLGGQLFKSAHDYRRAVDEQLFQLGQARYHALMDTLVQLRQPQLSKKPDESSLSQALTEALPPIPPELLADVAEALTQLEEHRRELQEYEALEQAVDRFSQRYRRYAAIQSRRQARHVRSAQTSFDHASRALNEQRQAWQATQTAETQAQSDLEQAHRARAASQARLETLKSDPAMADALTLSKANTRAVECQQAASQAQARQHSLRQRLETQQASTQACLNQKQRAGQILADSRNLMQASAQQAGLATPYHDSPLARDQDSFLSTAELNVAQADLRRARDIRQAQIRVVLQRCTEVEQARLTLQSRQAQHAELQDELQDAAARRETADGQVEDASQSHVQAWLAYLDGLQQLQIDDTDQIIQVLGAWTLALTGDSPAQMALLAAQQTSSQRLAQQQAVLQVQQSALQSDQARLLAEQKNLTAGTDPAPTPAPWQENTRRTPPPGAPFWQLVDFQPQVDVAQRAGLEAALQAAGLLDAWVSPNGELQDAQGQPLADRSWWQARLRQTASLADWLAPARATDLPEDPALRQTLTQIDELLGGIACGVQDPVKSEAWVAPDGRFRLGTLCGSWHKAQAQHIGHAARASARALRLVAIQTELQDLEHAQDRLVQRQARCQAAQQQATTEWQNAPSDTALRRTHAQAESSAREYVQAQQRLQQAAQRRQDANDKLAAAQETLQTDATDLRLPETSDGLHIISRHLQDFADTLGQLANNVHNRQHTTQEWQQQIAREQQAQDDSTLANAQAVARRIEADQAQAHWDTLQASIGAQVQALEAQLQQAEQALAQAEGRLADSHKALLHSTEARARCEQKTEAVKEHLNQRTEQRRQTITQWQAFAATGLLISAIVALDIPARQDAWSIETALTLARRTEQALSQVPDDDTVWSRVQTGISQDYTELGRALTALGHQAQAETSDFGLVVQIVYRNRPERPDQLHAELNAEIAQRRELLSAREREILETHLQAEISSAIQKRLREAQQQILAINQELHQRPTTTGVRFRLKWETLPEGADGAPVGLEAAREHLLNTSTDLWSAEDRQVVGEMLQQRIEAERIRSDVLPGSALLDQLERALDYRRWHRFRIERWDGAWRSLSGPASSGERALGLTIPLFAAVSSFYAQDSRAPRLVLLDEVFAGIDNPARTHCWALIREFDLDFVVTSEREWACSAELPGVAIAQLQRREGIDAVHVSRWTWDGRRCQPDVDPNRRFPPATDTGKGHE